MIKEIDYRDVLNERLQDPKFKAEWDAMALERQITRVLLDAREQAHITQAQLASRTGINQSEISKYESGSGHPSLKTLERLAQAMGLMVQIKFVSREEIDCQM